VAVALEQDNARLTSCIASAVRVLEDYKRRRLDDPDMAPLTVLSMLRTRLSELLP
jgi:hypothetical protein